MQLEKEDRRTSHSHALLSDAPPAHARAKKTVWKKEEYTMKKFLFAILLSVGSLLTTDTGVKWTTYPPLKQVSNLAPVLADIESHLPYRHPYRNPGDKVNWVHEGSHGIASDLRIKYHEPGFYELQDRAVLMKEPSCSLREVARLVPKSLRGRGYSLYLVRAQSDWNQQPTYVFDEWTAFTNGTQSRNEYGMKDRTDTVESMVEFIPYALCVLQASGNKDPQIRAFIKWEIERALKLYKESGVTVKTLDILRDSADAEYLRVFVRTCYGED